MIRDIRFALKLLWKDRGFAATAILTLAVCIGSNTAIFTMVSSALLRPLRAPEADRILLMSNQYPKAGTGVVAFTNSGVPDYYDRLRDVQVFEEQAMYNFTSLTMGERLMVSLGEQADDKPSGRGSNQSPPNRTRGKQDAH